MKRSLLLLPAIAAVAAIGACGTSSSAPAPDSASADGGDAGAARACTTPAPTLGDSPEARALAATPAQCGQAAFTWLSSPKLGDVVAVGARESYTGPALAVLASAGKITPPAPMRDATVEQIAYVTQDRGKLIDASALVAWPAATAPGEPLDVLLVLHGTSGFNDACAPSTDPGARQLAATLAGLGYVVVAPDYIGLRALEGPTGFLHPYLVGQATAIASLDAVRAAAKHVAAATDAPCPTTRYVTVGGSQGGHAALWVDRLAPYYAAELELDGVVATVPPADLVGETTRALRDVVPATANTVAFLAASSDWYGVRGRLGEVLVPPYDTAVPKALAESCDGGGVVTKDATLDQVFQSALLAAAAPGGAGVASLDPWGCIVRENGLTTTSVARLPTKAPSYGILWVVGEKDTLVNTPIETTSFQTLCSGGMAMSFLECAGAGHVDTTKWSLPEILDFARDRFAGKPMDPATTCNVTAPVRCRATP